MADEKFLCRVVQNSPPQPPCSTQVGHPVAYESRPLGGGEMEGDDLPVEMESPLGQGS